MAYQATGKPAGRPRKDGTPPKPAKQEPAKAHANVRQEPAQHRPFSLAPCCPECHPSGWPEGWTGYGCPHGIWARRI